MAVIMELGIYGHGLLQIIQRIHAVCLQYNTSTLHAGSYTLVYSGDACCNEQSPYDCVPNQYDTEGVSTNYMITSSITGTAGIPITGDAMYIDPNDSCNYDVSIYPSATQGVSFPVFLYHRCMTISKIILEFRVLQMIMMELLQL